MRVSAIGAGSRGGSTRAAIRTIDDEGERSRLFVYGWLGRLEGGGCLGKLAPQDADITRSLDGEGDPIAGDPPDFDRDLVTDLDLLACFAAEN